MSKPPAPPPAPTLALADWLRQQPHLPVEAVAGFRRWAARLPRQTAADWTAAWTRWWTGAGR